MITVTDYKVVMIGIPLDKPFELKYFKLHTLPRVLVMISATNGSGTFTGIGEASIDFPFIKYDLWDVMYSLQKLNIIGRSFVGSVDETLPPLIVSAEEEKMLLEFPAALTALTMANDDVWMRANNRSMYSLAVRQSGKPMKSIGYGESQQVIMQAIEYVTRGYIPKIKLGLSFEYDVEILSKISHDSAFAKSPGTLSADFNAAYTFSEAMKLFKLLESKGVWLDSFCTIEQPLTINATEEEAKEFSLYLSRAFEWSGSLIADEPIITIDDAIKYVRAGWRINYKMHRIGGIREALKMEQATSGALGMVGGTFPTAIGRAYDLWAVGVLSCAQLPSDGWEPSTDWFSNDKHLIVESFAVDSKSHTHLFDGLGFGVTADWEKINTFIINNPDEEYRLIREGKSGKHIRVELRHETPYPDLYRKLTGRDPLWNL